MIPDDKSAKILAHGKSMKLTEPLKILKGLKSRKGGTCFLATGLNPLHQLGEAPAPDCEISRRAFEARVKILQQTKEMIHG
jgi:hypothetical protein